MGLLNEKVAVVTGAGKGIGREHCLALAEAGAAIVVNDLGQYQDSDGVTRYTADDVAAEIRAAGGQAVANHDSVTTWEGAEKIIAAAIDAFGFIDILVNNAGILRDKTLLKMTEAMWDPVLDVHLKGTFLCSRFAAAIMRKQGRGGRIINTSSLAGLKGNIGQSNYGAAKAGVFGLTRIHSLELKRYRVTVNAIAPVALTDMTRNLGVVPEEMSPDKISPFVVFLASSLAENINGRVFGLHGNEIFEYRMEQSPSINTASKWTPEAIAKALPKLSEPPKDKPIDDAASAQVKSVFMMLPNTLDPRRARSWKSVLHFNIGSAGRYTLKVSEGVATFLEGNKGDPTCTITFDSPKTFLGLVDGSVKAEQAFMSGKLKASDMGDLMKFSRCFDLSAVVSSSPPEATKAAPPTKGMNKDLIGKRCRKPAAFATPERLEAYARATNDLNPKYLSQSGLPPETASPLFAVCPGTDVLMATVLDPELNADMVNLVHGEQDMRFFTPIKPWDLITGRGVITGIEDKSSGQLLKVTTQIMCKGNVACEIKSSVFVRDPNAKRKPKKAAPKPSAPHPEPPPRKIIFNDTFTVDEDQSYRYADASGDHNPIHVNPKVAAAAGFPSVILHGLCSMAFCQRAIVNHVLDGDPSRLQRLSLRFARPVLPLDTLTVSAWTLESEDGNNPSNTKRVAFEVTNQDGKKVISNGLAEVLA